ncbi:hypothetical protein EJ063_03420 [Vibrio aquaticus]|uniref:Uncharacterized protein n=1 Tax=Vibrio aquaticus TaxID=2496559 RepID=A0A3S0V4S5_9VIBR|nr:DUF6232 family protein [Vibrio aquaticus]RTZ17848.1 hypothetical protein EJ063_03420 [Vibrio aquaticus]
MYKESDIRIENGQLHFKKDSYPLSKINDVRVKSLTLLDNLGQIAFWVFLFSGAVWLAIPDIRTAPTWLQVLAVSLTIVGLAFSLFRCSRYALQVEFRHIDETGVQWVNVAKSYAQKDGELFRQQAEVIKRYL